MNLIMHALAGASIGVLNGLFGAGGGIVAVSFLKKLDGEAKSAHATAILITLFLSAASSYMYVTRGNVTFSDALPYLPGGIIGAVVGALFLKKIPDFWLRKVFAVFILYSATRLLFR
ncbi:sulfite exporter TauE/SafE family protein [Hydrogenoanaerobacterium sp.]|uniref:sulfite exporter TauE/SafE family protein n=1 Tax=Hydrogenoanaerobacterium sp. TaxID=2953763 RepID=UPI0028978219|nr:sulfite exporter TauE/SafE family protein [Hydrogenoanaerobacterium sp.]